MARRGPPAPSFPDTRRVALQQKGARTVRASPEVKLNDAKSSASALRQRPRGIPLVTQVSTRIGCSGWTYDDWRGPFYPETVRLKERLAYYASVFDTTEINGSFYRLPSEDAVGAWADRPPRASCFPGRCRASSPTTRSSRTARTASIWSSAA